MNVIEISEVKAGDSIYFSGGFRQMTKVADYKGRSFWYGKGGVGFLGTEMPEQPLFAVNANHPVTRRDN